MELDINKITFFAPNFMIINLFFNQFSYFKKINITLVIGIIFINPNLNPSFISFILNL